MKTEKEIREKIEDSEIDKITMFGKYGLRTSQRDKDLIKTILEWVLEPSQDPLSKGLKIKKL